MTRRARILGTILLALVLVTAARELGGMDFQFEKSFTTGTNMVMIKGRDRLAQNFRIGFVDDGERQLGFISQTSEDASTSTWTEHWIDGDEQELDPAFQAGEEPTVAARVTRFDITGCTWTPLVKWAHVEFTVYITSADSEVAGLIDGTVERKSLGLISSRRFRAGLREAVRDKLVGTLMP